MVITFHVLMLRSEKNNAAQNALGFTKKKLQPICTVKQTDFRNNTKSPTADFEMQTNVSCLRLEYFCRSVDVPHVNTSNHAPYFIQS